MPQRINGIGTWYYGKTNVRARSAACPFCGKPATLVSYDTTLYFSFFFVPVIPLSRMKIYDQCSRCRRHLAISLAKYNANGRQQAAAALAQYQANPADPAVAGILMELALTYDAKNEFLQAAPLIERHQPSAHMQAMLATAYEFFSRPDEAEAAYLRSLKLEPNDDVREALGLLYLKQRRASEAKLYFQHILQKRLENKRDSLRLLAEGFQSEGLHRDALATLTATMQAFPIAAESPMFKKLQAVSEKNLTSGKPISSRDLAAMRIVHSGYKPKAPLWPKLIVPALALIAIAIYLLAAFMQGQSRSVFVVNGLRHPYEVTINDQTIRVYPLSNARIHVPEGAVRVVANDSFFGAVSETCTISTPFLTRPFSHKVFVINPDKAAIVYQEHTVYAVGGGSAAEHGYAARGGNLLYEFDDVDYPFETFPDQIKLESHTSRTRKSRVALIADPDPVHAADALGENHAAIEAVARHLMEGEPDNAEVLAFATEVISPQQSLELLRKRLGMRPVLIELHRFYQNLQEQLHPESDVEAEYRRYLAAEPNNSALKYLLGRECADRAEASRLFHEAAEATPPVAHGDFALAYAALASADFPTALDYIGRAQTLSPDYAPFQEIYRQTLLAMHRYDALIDAIRQHRSERPGLGLLIQELQALALAKRDGEADALLNEEIRKVFPPDEWQHFKGIFSAMAQYARGNVEEYARGLDPDDPSKGPSFNAEIARGHIDAASSAMKNPVSQQHLLMYVVAAAAGREEIAQTQLQLAIKKLGAETKDHREVAAWLSSTTAPDPNKVCAQNSLPHDKALMLTAMGLRFPQHQAKYFELARLLNFEPVFPYWTLRGIHDRLPATQQ